MAQDFYSGQKWQHKRRAILRRDGYMDQIERRYGKAIEATIVHHIFPLEDFPEYALEDWNLISVSLATHNRLHDRETRALTPAGMELMRRTARARGMPIC